MTSVSHLVENELPLASVVLPSMSISTIDRRLYASQSSMNELQMSQDLNEIVSEDEHKKSTSGSVNNLLLRENTNGVIDEKMQDVSQNVYSNIPPTSPSVPTILKNAAADHVYSNIDETNISSTANGYSLSDSLDLDLDDPLLTSSFIHKKKEKPNSHQHIYNAPSTVDTSQNANKLILPSISSSSSTTGTQITSIELKNVLNVVLQKSTETKPSNVAPPSLRQTMIDTALDLDSLDGSIGNNSQVALMSNKTAIV